MSWLTKDGWVYFIGEPWEDGGRQPVKIGWATRPESRVRQIQNGYPYYVEVLAAFRGTMQDEYKLHAHMNRLRLQGEWFRRVEPIVTAMRRLRGKSHGVFDQGLAWVLEREVWTPPVKKRREPWVYNPSPEVLKAAGIE